VENTSTQFEAPVDQSAVLAIKFDADEESSIKDSSLGKNDGTLYGDTLLLMHFDEGSGQYANDSTAYNNDGVLGNDTGTTFDPTWKSGSSCKYGGCLEFDGVDDYVNVSDSSSTKPTSAFSIALWFKANEITDAWLISKQNVSNAADYNNGFLIRLNSPENFAQFWVGNGTNYVVAQGGGDTITTGNWYFIAGVFNGSHALFYQDGTLLATSTASITGGVDYTDVADMLIGKHQTGGLRFFNGSIDELVIYNRSLTASEVQALYEAGKAKFIEYTSVNDEEGKFGDAVVFDGVDDYIEVPEFTIYNTGTLFDFWVKSTDTSGLVFRFDQSTPSWEYYILELGSGGVRTRFYNGSNILYSDFAPVLDDQWHHVTFTWEPNGTKTTVGVYKDGGIVSLRDYDVVLHTVNINHAYNRQVGTPGFNGSIDDVRIYNRALTPEEIYQHYVGWLANRTVNYPDGTTRVHKIVELNDFKELDQAPEYIRIGVGS
jgi:hypothetical protein